MGKGDAPSPASVRALGQPVNEELRAQLRTFVERFGEAQTLRILELSRQTLTRALAGLGMRRGSHLLIEETLRRKRSWIAVREREAGHG